MQAHLDHDLPLKEIAAAPICRLIILRGCFKKLTGTAPHAYLARLRPRQRKRWLAETDLSITEISSAWVTPALVISRRRFAWPPV